MRPVERFDIAGYGRVIVYQTNDPADIDLIQRLRYRTYCEELMGYPTALFPEGKEFDKWDSYAYQIVAKSEHDSKIVGCLRLVTDSKFGFPMEESCVLPRNLNRSEGVEASRAIVVPELRRRGLIKKIDVVAQEFCKSNGYRWWCLLLREHLLRSKYSQGWNIMEISSAFSHHGYVVVPVIVFL